MKGFRKLFPDTSFKLFSKFRIVEQQLLYGIPAMSKFSIVVAEPLSGFLDHVLVNSNVDDLPYFTDSFSVHDIEFRQAERRSNFVLHHFHLCTVSIYAVAFLDLTDPADIETNRCIIFQSISAC